MEGAVLSRMGHPSQKMNGASTTFGFSVRNPGVGRGCLRLGTIILTHSFPIGNVVQPPRLVKENTISSTLVDLCNHQFWFTLSEILQILAKTSGDKTHAF